MAKYKYGTAIAPTLPEAANHYSYKIICGGSGRWNLVLSNVQYVWALYSWPVSYGCCLPEGSPLTTCYVYDEDLQKKWVEVPVVRTNSGNDYDYIYMNFGRVVWSNVNIYYANSDKLGFEGSAASLYCPDLPVVDSFKMSHPIAPVLDDEAKEYLYGNVYVTLEASSPDKTYISAQLFCNGEVVGETSEKGSLKYKYKVPLSEAGTQGYYAILKCYYLNKGEKDSGNVTTKTVSCSVVEYDLLNYDPETETDTSGTISPGSVTTTTSIDTGTSTVNPSSGVYEDSEDDETTGGTDNTTDGIWVDDTSQTIVLKNGTGSMSLLLGWYIGNQIRSQMNGEDDVDAELFNGVLYIKNASAEMNESVLEVT